MFFNQVLPGALLLAGVAFGNPTMMPRQDDYMLVCTRPLEFLDFTTAVVHCYIDLGDDSFAFDTDGVHTEHDTVNDDRDCRYISGTTADQIRSAVAYAQTTGQWEGSEYDLCGRNCCNFVDTILKTAGSAGVKSYFDGYGLPPDWLCRRR